jgi:hypothetical protein
VNYVDNDNIYKLLERIIARAIEIVAAGKIAEKFWEASFSAKIFPIPDLRARQ